MAMGPKLLEVLFEGGKVLAAQGLDLGVLAPLGFGLERGDGGSCGPITWACE